MSADSDAIEVSAFFCKLLDETLVESVSYMVCSSNPIHNVTTIEAMHMAFKEFIARPSLSMC